MMLTLKFFCLFVAELPLAIVGMWLGDQVVKSIRASLPDPLDAFDEDDRSRHRD